MESRDKGRPKKVEPIVQAIYHPAVHELCKLAHTCPSPGTSFHGKAQNMAQRTDRTRGHNLIWG